MISPINIAGINYKIEPDIQEYAKEKIGKLDRYIPESVREATSADIKFRRAERESGLGFDAEVVLHLPNKTIAAEDEQQTTEKAAIDVVQEKLAGQLRKYKVTHG